MIIWWHIRAFLYDVLDFIKLTFGRMLYAVRLFLYSAFSFMYKIGMIAFIASFYFMYKCVKEYQQGVPLKEMENINLAIFLFLAPIIIAAVRELVRPKIEA